MKIAEKNIQDKLISAAKKCQQNFYELLSDWNSYDNRKPQCLKNFIGIALFGPPKINDIITSRSFSSGKSLADEVFFNNTLQQKKIDKVYEKIVRHGIQNTSKKEIMCGIVYNVTFNMKSIRALKHIFETGKCFSDEHMVKFLQPVPIFRVLKNVIKNQDGKRVTKKLVIYYIDDLGRVYKSWNDYLGNNVLPECIMVVPKNGEYQGDDKKQWTEKMSYVWTEVYESPACKTNAINTIDSINTLVSLGCAGVGVAAVFNPVGATVMALSAVGMGLSGLWSMGRSSHELADRHLHEQSISINDKDGLSRWIGVASSALAVVSSGGSMLLSQAVQNGNSLSTVAKVAHSSIQIGSIAVSGFNVGLVGYNLIESHLEKKVSAQDALNLVASLLLFSNSAVDLQLSSSIIEKNQSHFIRDFELSLRSSRHRKEFRRMVRNSTSLLSSSKSSPEQIIRSIAKISNKDLFSTSIIRNQKTFILKGMGISSSDGSITIDGKSLMKPEGFVKEFKKKSHGIKPVTLAITNDFSVNSRNVFEKVLKNFLTKYRKEFQNSKPTLAQFLPFLMEVYKVNKADVMFAKLLLIGNKFVRKINKEKYPVKIILAETIDFLWKFIQVNLKERIGSSCKYENHRESLMKIIIGIHTSVENNLDEWLDSFKDYLQFKLKQIQQKTNSDKKGRVYVLHVI